MHIYRCPTTFSLETYMKALRLAAFALIAVAASATSMATNYNLGNITVPGRSAIQDSTVTGATFSDSFDFSFTYADPVFSTSVLFDYYPENDVLFSNVSLIRNSGSETLGLVTSESIFSTGNYTFQVGPIKTGSYSLVVTGSTVNGSAGSYGVRVGLVPEPGTLALFGLGLAGAAFAARRGKAVRAA